MAPAMVLGLMKCQRQLGLLTIWSRKKVVLGSESDQEPLGASANYLYVIFHIFSVFLCQSSDASTRRLTT